VHTHTTGLAPLQDGIVALCALDIFHKLSVALPQVGWHMLPLALEYAILGPKWLAVLARLIDFPQASILLTKHISTLNRSDAVS